MTNIIVTLEHCKSCGHILHNIEYHDSQYYSYICVNNKCELVSKVVAHGRWDDRYKSKAN